MDLQTVIGLIARHALTTLAGMLAAHGYLGGSTIEQFVAGGMVLLGALWSWWQKSGQKQVEELLKKMTGTKTAAGAVAVAQSMAPQADAPQVKVAKQDVAEAIAKPAATLCLLIAITALMMAHAFAAQQNVGVFPAAPTVQAAQKDPLLLIKQFALDDLQAALHDANAQNPPDAAGARCWTALIALANSASTSGVLPKKPGAFAAVQKTRDLVRTAQSFQGPNGPLAALADGCSTVVLDGQTTLLMLGIKAGLIAGAVPTGGLTLPAIPAIGGLFPSLFAH